MSYRAGSLTYQTRCFPQGFWGSDLPPSRLPGTIYVWMTSELHSSQYRMAYHPRPCSQDVGKAHPLGYSSLHDTLSLGQSRRGPLTTSLLIAIGFSWSKIYKGLSSRSRPGCHTWRLLCNVSNAYTRTQLQASPLCPLHSSAPPKSSCGTKTRLGATCQFH